MTACKHGSLECYGCMLNRKESELEEQLSHIDSRITFFEGELKCIFQILDKIDERLEDLEKPLENKACIKSNTHNFKVGDMVRVYNGAYTTKGIIIEISKELLCINNHYIKTKTYFMIDGWFHYKQCRKLVKKNEKI